MKWLSRSSPRVLRRWVAGAPKGDGTYDLASWLRYDCPTAGTTAQTGLRNVKSGFAADAPRAFSRDGVNFGWLIEGPTTNLQPTDDLSAFGASGSPIVNQVALPTGALGYNEVIDDDVLDYEYVFDNNALGVVPNPHTLSFWSHVVSLSGGIARVKVREAGNTDLAKVDIASTEGGWTYHSATELASSVGDAEVFVIPADAQSANTGILRAALIQVEAGLSPSSYVLGSRAAGIVSLPAPTIVFPGGYYDFVLVWAPTFSSAEHAGFTLAFIDLDLGHNDGITVTAGNVITQTIDGVTANQIGPVTWSRDQVLYTRLRHGPSGTYMKAMGFTSGDGEVSGTPKAATVLPATVYLFGGASGPSQGINVALREVKFLEAA